jgi:hydrogenase expression/formation protein
MDLEEYARRQIRLGISQDAIRNGLADRILEFKDRAGREYAEELADAVIQEVQFSSGLHGDFFEFERSGVGMGEFGVGSRGTGDFFAHRELARIIGKTSASVGVDEMDDAGAVALEGSGEERQYIISTVDGMHSRLSDFPFLAGFHVTRATLRDVYVMGARPLALLSDIHVADDGDVAKIFDYTAGITVVSDLMDVPLVTGSTLRIGGDMVLGGRLTGCVGAVGVATYMTARKGTAPGDVLLMTEGAGGGTIATAAIYSGFPDVVEKTINLQFLRACEALLADPVIHEIHAMTDVTNGGLRGDVYEIAETANCRIIIEEEHVRGLVDPAVGEMLESLKIDYLGVSLDALLLVAPRQAVPAITGLMDSIGVRVAEIGRVEAGLPGVALMVDGREQDFTPRFRESAYTPVKKVVDRNKADFSTMKTAVRRAADAAIEKKNRVIRHLSL